MSDRIVINSRTGSVNFKLRKHLEEEPVDPMDKEIVLKQKSFDEKLQTKYDEGYQQAFDLLKDDFNKKYDEKVNEKYEKLNSMISELDEKMKQYEKLFANKVMDFSFFIAEKILHREIKNESIIKNSISDSVKKVIGANSVIIKLNPDEIETMSKENEQLLNNSSFSKISFESDERVEIGGCIVKTEIGSVDARISSQLNEIKKILDNEELNYSL